MRNARIVAQALVSNNWLADIRGTLALRGARECLALWAAVMGLQRDPAAEDLFRWPWDKSGELIHSYIHLQNVDPTQHKISHGGGDMEMQNHTAEQVVCVASDSEEDMDSVPKTRHGLQEATSPCFVCLQEEDTADYILVQCVHVREVWLSERIAMPGASTIVRGSSMLAFLYR